MPPFGTSIQSFLRSTRTSLSSSANARYPLTIVVGNQSADLDSILSALVLAYILQSQSLTTKRTFVPLANLEPSDLLLRPELLSALSHAKLQPSDLFTLYDLRKSFASPERHEGAEGRTKWILVDHNKLELPFSSPKWNISKEDVIGCLDHHDDENYVPPQRSSSAGKESAGADMRIIQKTGSCMSHIINYARQSGIWKDTGPLNQELSFPQASGPEHLEFEAHTALIALAPILIDTLNLEDPNKTTETDLEAVEFLEGKVVAWETSKHSQGRGQDSYIRNAYFEEIRTAKHDLEPLTLQQILRKDYKEWEDEKGRRVGISVVEKPLEWMVEKIWRSESPDQKYDTAKDGKSEVFWEEVNQFVESRIDEPSDAGNHNKGLDVYGIMTAFTDEKSGEFAKELVISPISKIGIEALSSFEKGFKEKYRLEPKPAWNIKCGRDGVRIWDMNVVPSRKQVGPALREVLKNARL